MQWNKYWEKEVKVIKWRRILSLLGVLLFVFTSLHLRQPLDVSADTGNDDSLAGKYYRIKSRYSSYYLDVNGGSTEEGTPILLWSKNEPMSMNQVFRLETASETGYYKIICQHSGQVFDIYGASNDNNVQVIQYTNKDTANQQFELIRQDDGAYKIKVRHSGQFLTIKSDNMNRGAELVQWPYKTSGADNQAWYLEEVSISYANLDEYLEQKVNNDHVITTSILLQGASNYGISTDADTIKAKVTELLNGKPDTTVFTDNTGYITTYGMLQQSIEQIAFASAHNAFANNEDRRSSYAWDTYTTGHNLGTENHKISVKTMLDVGYRILDLDIGDNGNGKTGCYHRYRLSGYSNLFGNNSILPKVKTFLDENPSEIVILYLSDVYNGTINPFKLKNNAIYHKGEEGWMRQVNNLIANMRDADLLDMTYNFSGNENTAHADLYNAMNVPGVNSEWPTLKDMLQNNKRVIFLERETKVVKNLQFNNQNGDPNNTTKENLILDESLVNDLQGNSANKLLNITCMEDWGASAGDINAAKINNNGRRIYDIFTKANNYFSEHGLNKVMNSINVDYATGNTKQGGWIGVSPVDAVNRLNYDHFQYPWNSSLVGKWYWE